MALFSFRTRSPQRDQETDDMAEAPDCAMLLG